ncbi:MAG TPA: lysyl-tRNA synthetase [Dermatophilaceae bacterium]|nr:lysyl-tRNA synthetase [Dermatophilaceae bacterium]
MSLQGLWLVIAALLPSAGIALLFYGVVKAMLEGDRRERLAHSRWLAEQERGDRRETQRDS